MRRRFCEPGLLRKRIFVIYTSLRLLREPWVRDHRPRFRTRSICKYK
jgi:hypothetical protein